MRLGIAGYIPFIPFRFETLVFLHFFDFPTFPLVFIFLPTPPLYFSLASGGGICVLGVLAPFTFHLCQHRYVSSPDSLNGPENLITSSAPMLLM